MRVGITGSRNGLTHHQRLHLIGWFQGRGQRVADSGEMLHMHHGDCLGVDKEAHEVVSELALRSGWRLNLNIVVHPPESPKLRAWCVGDEMWEERPYLERDRDIVNCVDWLLAYPSGREKEPGQERSGTWYTVRYAKKMDKRITVYHDLDGFQEYFPDPSVWDGSL